MVFADLKGIFLGTRPSKVEHAAKTGWSGLSEPTLLVDDMSVRDSWARRLEASAQDQRRVLSRWHVARSIFALG
jgi:hypothetical protein